MFSCLLEGRAGARPSLLFVSKCVLQEKYIIPFLIFQLANNKIRAILRAVSKLTAEMPMRYAW